MQKQNPRIYHFEHQKTGKFRVTETDTTKSVHHDDLHLGFRKTDGYTVMEGIHVEEYSPVGPFIADIEIVTICHGVPQKDGTKKLCEFCSPVGTKINTPDGHVDIDQLTIGQQVLSFNEETRTVITNDIKELYQREYSGDMIVIETESGDVLKLTPNHLVLTNFGWLESGNLTEEMEIIEYDK
jgi:hypothetical protein